MQAELLADFDEIYKGTLESKAKVLHSDAMRWMDSIAQTSEEIDRDNLTYSGFIATRGDNYCRGEDIVHADLPRSELVKFLVTICLTPQASTIVFPHISHDELSEDEPLVNSMLFRRDENNGLYLRSPLIEPRARNFIQAQNRQVTQIDMATEVHVAPPMHKGARRILLTYVAHKKFTDDL